MDTTSATTVGTPSSTAYLPVFLAILRESWRFLVLWSAVMVFAVVMVLPLYETTTTPSALAAVNRLPQWLYGTLRFDYIHTGPGYVQATIFSGVGFLVMSAAGIQWGSSAITRGYEKGSLARTKSYGVGNVRYCLEASAAVLTCLSAVALVTYFTIRLMNQPLGLELKMRLLGQTTIVWLGLGVLLAAVAILVGAYTGRRAWAIGVGVAVAVSSYAVDAVSRLNPNWHWMADLSAVDWAFGDNPLWKGLDGWGEVTLWLLSLALIACAAWVFQWREQAAQTNEGE